jgi:hypothetical protein
MLSDISIGERSGRVIVRSGKGNKARSELPLNSWSRETFEVYSSRKRVNKHEASAKDLPCRV